MSRSQRSAAKKAEQKIQDAAGRYDLFDDDGDDAYYQREMNRIKEEKKRDKKPTNSFNKTQALGMGRDVRMSNKHTQACFK